MSEIMLGVLEMPDNLFWIDNPMVRYQHNQIRRKAAAEIRSLRDSVGFYRRRCEALQSIQNRMRDPERKAVCDILANGSTYVFNDKEVATKLPESWSEP